MSRVPPARRNGLGDRVTSILVVDDSAADRQLCAELLARRDDWTVCRAAHGLAALERLAEQAVDLVVTDLLMPELDGLGLIERMRETLSHIPVVVMTARGSEEIAVRALEAGAASYVPKKALGTHLVETVERILAASREHASYRRLLGRIRQASFVLENDLDLIDALVSYLTRMLRDQATFDESDCHRISTALDEALTNAYYHGNLEVGSETRESDPTRYRDTARRRRDEAPYRDRRIYVTARFTDDETCFIIRDDGNGFDLSRLANPTSLEFLERPSGRGVFLMNAFMDELQYNDAGNEVTLVKRRAGKPSRTELASETGPIGPGPSGAEH